VSYWAKRIGLALFGLLLAAGAVLVVLWARKQGALDKAKAALDAAKAKLELDRLNVKNDEVTKNIEATAAKRALAEAELKAKVDRLKKTLQTTETMTDEEIDRDLARRGYL
jgi:NAD(P)-dependent dehydrogenase (short-subunit alcohol dehydrogenase family)